MVSLPDLILPHVKYFGLSIDRGALRAVELAERNRVLALAEVEIPEDLFTDGILTKKDVFVEILKSLYARGKFTTPYVSVSFPEAYAYTREYTLPSLPVEEIQEAMSWHIKGLFPFSEDEIYFDWRILSATDKEYHLAVVAVQKTVLDPLVAAIIAAGLKPLRFEPDASAITRLLAAREDRHAIVVDVNKKGAYATLVEGAKSIFTTVVPFGPGDTDATYRGNVRRALSEVTSYYTLKGVLSAEEPIEVILTGERAAEGWEKELAMTPTSPVRVLTTPVNLPSFNKAYAAAAANIAPPSNTETINLLPPGIQTRYDTERTVSFRRAVAMRVLFLVMILCISSFAVNAAVGVRKQRLDSEVKQLTEVKNAQGSIGNELLLLNAQAKHIIALGALRTTPKDTMLAFGKLLTDDISLSQWDYDDTKLQFTLIGTAQSREGLLAFKERLEKGQDFAKVTLPLGSLETPLNIRFTMTFVTK